MSRRIEVRFYSRIEVTDDCWLWTGPKNAKGYGYLGRGGRGAPKVLAHRLMWELVQGSIPNGMRVLHRCDNPPCVRPSHLWIGTQAENLADMTAKGRARRNGQAKLDKESVAAIRNATGSIREIAPQFGVAYSTVARIRRGESYV